MSFTRIDSHFLRGPAASSDASSYVGLNPRGIPGSFVAAGASAVRKSVGGQVACKLSIEHFVEAMLSYFDNQPASGQHPSVEALEVAFKRANTSVYEFGHKLAAGGRMAASLIALVVEDEMIGVGRVGQGSAYLIRSGEVLPFLESVEEEYGDPAVGKYVGTQSLVSAELANVPIQEHDVVLLFSEMLDAARERELVKHAPAVEWGAQAERAAFARRIFAGRDDYAFIIATQIGPRAIYLGTPVE